MKYQAGDKVRCVTPTAAAGVRVGKVYTVKAFSHNSTFGTHIVLEEVLSTPTECVFELVKQAHQPKPKVGDVVECIDTGGWPLTVGKQYVVQSVTADYIRVINDRGTSGGYYPESFKVIPDAKPVLTPEEVLQYFKEKRQGELECVQPNGLVLNDMTEYTGVKYLFECTWRVKPAPAPEVIEVNGKKYIEIME